MDPIMCLFITIAVIYVLYLLGRLRLMGMPIVVSEEEGCNIVAMIDRSIRRCGLEVSCKGKDYFTITKIDHGYSNGPDDVRFFCMLYKNNYKTYSEWLKYRKEKDHYFFIIKVDEYPLWKQKEFIKQAPTFENQYNRQKKLEAIKNICKEDV